MYPPPEAHLKVFERSYMFTPEHYPLTTPMSSYGKLVFYELVQSTSRNSRQNRNRGLSIPTLCDLESWDKVLWI